MNNNKFTFFGRKKLKVNSNIKKFMYKSIFNFNVSKNKKKTCFKNVLKHVQSNVREFLVQKLKTSKNILL